MSQNEDQAHTANWKHRLKATLNRIGLLNAAQELKYRATILNRNSRHPRRRVYRFYQQFIRSGDLVFDIGANVGERVAVFLELGARVVAVEPQTHCIEQMRKRFAAFRHVDFEHCGISDVEGTLTLNVCDQDCRLSTFSADQIRDHAFGDGIQWSGREVVRVITLDTLVERYGLPAFCKIDVEGHESSVLRGQSTPLRALSFEFSSIQRGKLEECLDTLRATGGYEFNVGFGDPQSLHFGQWVGPAAILDAVKRLAIDSHAWGDVYARQCLRPKHAS